MSSIFSDPFWRRGSTLLTGEPIELDASGNPVAGTEVIGQVKAFQDVSPTGHGSRHSNKLVYCVAVRYTGSTVADSSTIAGKRYNLNAAQTEVSALRTKANADAAIPSGILDEYLVGELRANDIVWLVVKGPCNVVSSGAVSAGANVGQVAGGGGVLATAGGSNSATVDGTALAAAASNKCRVNLHSNFI
jgi:hypothetical protein